MKTANLTVMYPTPTDVAIFEHYYEQEHLPLALEKLKGKIRFDGQACGKQMLLIKSDLLTRMVKISFNSSQA